VVVVKDDAESRRIGPDHKVVVGTDGSSAGEAAVDFAAACAAEVSAALEIVTSTGEHPTADIDAEQLRANADSIAHSAADRVAETHSGLAVTTRVEDSPAERTLVDASADAGLVVVGTRGRGAFKGMVLGSVSHAVIYGSQCPVVVVE
jgi:nucleotide-binding universal stress UspA family protein